MGRAAGDAAPLGEPHAYYTTETGDLNQFMHPWRPGLRLRAA
ncbi:hypothetical protein [Variovorax sp. JS1663]|nr:hypothetical protein [Variovorax sp. JS1663]